MTACSALARGIGPFVDGGEVTVDTNAGKRELQTAGTTESCKDSLGLRALTICICVLQNGSSVLFNDLCIWFDFHAVGDMAPCKSASVK